MWLVCVFSLLLLLLFSFACSVVYMNVEWQRARARAEAAAAIGLSETRGFIYYWEEIEGAAVVAFTPPQAV